MPTDPRTAHAVASDSYRGYDGKPQTCRRLVCRCGYAVSHSSETASKIMREHIKTRRLEETNAAVNR